VRNALRSPIVEHANDDPTLDDVVTEWISIPELAEQIGETASRVRDLVREGKLIVIERGQPAVKSFPAAFVHDGELIKGLSGALTVLADAGYRPEQAVRWLFTEQEALPGRPVDLMTAGRHHAVKRLAMSLAF
jgi:hypothetical protein